MIEFNKEWKMSSRNSLAFYFSSFFFRFNFPDPVPVAKGESEEKVEKLHPQHPPDPQSCEWRWKTVALLSLVWEDQLASFPTARRPRRETKPSLSDCWSGSGW